MMPRWFGPKRIGYGIGPRGWQGWLVTAIFLGAIIGSRFVRPQHLGLPAWPHAAIVGVLIAAFLVLTVVTYGDDEDSD